MKPMRAGIVALVLAAVVAGCGVAASAAPGSPGAEPTAVPVPTSVSAGGSTQPPAASARVTLGIYSGRPDPAWALTAEQADKLVALIAPMPVVVGEAPQGGLGYHGFTVEITYDNGTVTTVTAFAKTISVAGAAKRYWRDDAGRAERFLLDTGRPFLAPGEIAVAEQSLADLLR